MLRRREINVICFLWPRASRFLSMKIEKTFQISWWKFHAARRMHNVRVLQEEDCRRLSTSLRADFLSLRGTKSGGKNLARLG